MINNLSISFFILHFIRFLPKQMPLNMSVSLYSRCAKTHLVHARSIWDQEFLLPRIALLATMTSKDPKMESTFPLTILNTPFHKTIDSTP